VQGRHTLGAATVEVLTGRGVLLAQHRREPDGAGVVARLDEHVAALTQVVLGAFTDRAPCRHKTRRAPSAAAVAEAERIRAARHGTAAVDDVVVDFARYAAATRAVNRGAQQ
jgi:hypothetical protein